MSIVIEREGTADGQADVDCAAAIPEVMAGVHRQLGLDLPAEAHNLVFNGEVLTDGTLQDHGVCGAGERVELRVKPQWLARLRLKADGVGPANYDSRFRQAVAAKDVDTVGLMVQAGDMDADVVTEALCNAARDGDEELAKVILKGSVAVEKELALLQATREQNYGIADALLAAGANVNYHQHGESCFTVTVELQDLERVELLVDNHNADVNKASTYHYTPLMIAANKSSLEIIKALLQRGAKIDATGSHGYTPLMVAAQKPRLDIVKYLVEDAKANVTKRGKRGDSCLFIACKEGHPELVEYFLAHGRGTKLNDFDEAHFEDVLRKMCRLGKLQAVQTLHSHGVTVNSVDGTRGESAVVAAVQESKLDVLQFLVEKGADVNRADRFGDTPLMIAARKGTADHIQFLLDAGVAKDKQDCDGDNALIIAARFGHLEIVKLLIKGGCDTSLKNRGGSNCLDAAVKAKYRDVAVYLKEEVKMTTSLDIPEPSPAAVGARGGRGGAPRPNGSGFGTNLPGNNSNAAPAFGGAPGQQQRNRRRGGGKGGDGPAEGGHLGAPAPQAHQPVQHHQPQHHQQGGGMYGAAGHVHMPTPHQHYAHAGQHHHHHHHHHHPAAMMGYPHPHHYPTPMYMGAAAPHPMAAWGMHQAAPQQYPPQHAPQGGYKGAPANGAPAAGKKGGGKGGKGGAAGGRKGGRQ